MSLYFVTVPQGPSSAYGADKEDFLEEAVDFLGPGHVTCGYTYEYDDYNIMPISRSPDDGVRGLLVGFLTDRRL